MNRRVFFAALAASAAAPAIAQTAAPTPAPLIYYAGAPGRLTMDRDAQGGNPFASALVDVLKLSPLTLRDFGQRLAGANASHSGGWHQAQLPRAVPDPKWRIDNQAGERRIALVLINSDYTQSDAYSLPGAAFDARRIPAALRDAGFETTLVLDASADQARAEMAAFARASQDADAALVYVGGHGLQTRRTVYWMMGDYPERDRRHLETHAIPLDEIAASARARRINLVLYASCRDDPFAANPTP